MKRHSIVGRPGERGSALIGVLLLLMMMSALAAALGVSGRTETLVARNHQSTAQAQAAAEAGLNHAVQVVIANIKANVLADVDATLDALLRGPDGMSGTPATDADNGSLEALAGWGVPLGTRLAIAGALNAQYEARVMDEDDPSRGLEGEDDDDDDDDEALYQEDGNPLNDTNRKLVIRAVGYAQDNTSVVLEAVIAPVQMPAIVTNGDLAISGNPTLTGSGGSVHSNANLTISGNPEISGNATASGSYSQSGNPDIDGLTGGAAAELTVPEVQASDYLAGADYILQSTGQLTLLDGSPLCDASSNNGACKAAWGWEFKGAGNGWALSDNNAADGTFYVEGPVKVSGNPGSDDDPIRMTIVAEGSIEISGNPDFTPDTPELMFVTDGDLKISGSLEMPDDAEGRILVHEQLMISGNPSLAGRVLVEDATSVDNLVTANSISGNATITYTNSLTSDTFTVAGWREIR